VVPSHTLRQVVRALTARTLAAAAVFFTIAVVLLAGSAAAGQHATAEADPAAATESVEASALAGVEVAAAPEPVEEAEPPEAAEPAFEQAEVPEQAEGAELVEQARVPQHDSDDEGEDGSDYWSDDEPDDHDYDSDDDEGDDDEDSGDEGGWTGEDGSAGEGGHDSDSGWVPGQPEYEGDKPDGSTGGPRVPRRTGAIGEAGGGGKGRSIAEAPSLSSPSPSSPGSSSTEQAAAQQPAVEQPATSTPPAAETPAATNQPNVTLRDDGSAQDPVRSLRSGQPVAGAGATTGAPADGGSADGGASGGVPAPAAGAGAFEPVGESAGGGDASASPERRAAGQGGGSLREDSTVVQTVNRLVEVVPDSLKFALAALAALSVLLGLGYLMSAIRARSLGRQRRELLQEVGLLQSALLPPVPDRIGGLRTTVAYRPADGPGAGGDFYDVLALPGGRVGFILGDVSGHGRGALARTAFMRYTLRAYLEAGLEPRVALQVAGRVIDDNLGGDFATVLLAVHDPDTGSLTYASAGHPAPIVAGPQPHSPVTVASSPPIGVGVRTGLRQTTVPLVPGSTACMFTDGLMEARVDGRILGRERLEEILEELGRDASAHGLIERVSHEARVLSDDIAAVVVAPTGGVTAGLFRTEQLELTAHELDGPLAQRFLESCGLPEDEVDIAIEDATMLADRFGGAILHVVFGNRMRVEVLPRNVESIEAASRRAAAR
jgi:hypothetical protein